MGELAINSHGIQPCPTTGGNCSSWVVTSTQTRNLVGLYICSFAFCLSILLTFVAVVSILIRLKKKKSIMGAASKLFITITFLELILICLYGSKFIRQGNNLLTDNANKLVMYMTAEGTFVMTGLSDLLPNICGQSNSNFCVCDDVYRLNKEIGRKFFAAGSPYFTELHKEYSCLADALDSSLTSFIEFHYYFPLLGLSMLQFILVANMLGNFWADLHPIRKGHVTDKEYTKIHIDEI